MGLTSQERDARTKAILRAFDGGDEVDQITERFRVPRSQLVALLRTHGRRVVKDRGFAPVRERLREVGRLECAWMEGPRRAR